MSSFLLFFELSVFKELTFDLQAHKIRRP